MGCACSTSAGEVSRPNLFQRNLCLHHKSENVLEHYKVVHELGKGAFGIVEQVQHIKSQKMFAMKTVTFNNASQKTEFEKEMDILRGLHHPNIVRMVETFEDQHHFYIIMELCEGGTMLGKVKERGSEFAEEEVKEIIEKLASVVQYLHSRYICHRDIKLDNILIESGDDPELKLCDFGASTLFRANVSMRKILGSVIYMAPEVLEGNYNESCDLWSLGVVMYMLLSNTPPFHAKEEDELIERIFEAKVSFEDPVWEKVSPEAKVLIKKLLNPDAATRFTAAQVLRHSWIKSRRREIPAEIFDEFVPRMKSFCQFSPFRRAALVAFAFCMNSHQMRKHSEAYNELNVAHNGYLTLEELQNAPILARFKLDWVPIFQAMDQSEKRGINLLEFVAATLSFMEVSNNELLLRAFELIDRKRSGFITAEDMQALLGQHFDLRSCEEMVKRTDQDRDGKIGFDDFAKMIKQPIRWGRVARISFRQGVDVSNLSSTERMVPHSTASTPGGRIRPRLSLNIESPMSVKNFHAEVHQRLELEAARSPKFNTMVPAVVKDASLSPKGSPPKSPRSPSLVKAKSFNSSHSINGNDPANDVASPTANGTSAVAPPPAPPAPAPAPAPAPVAATATATATAKA